MAGLFFLKKDSDFLTDLCYNKYTNRKGGRADMAYKHNTIVISVPVESSTNQMLRAIALLRNEKSKTQTASRILSKAIQLEYNKIRKEKQWNKNTNI